MYLPIFVCVCVWVRVSHVDKAIKEKKIIVNVVVSGTLWMG